MLTGKTELIHILQMREVSIKEITGLTQGHTANKSQKSRPKTPLPLNNYLRNYQQLHPTQEYYMPGTG